MSVGRRYGLADDEAQDVAQDTMLRLWAMRDTLDKYRSLESLAVTIARHRCVDMFKRKRMVPIDGRQVMEERFPSPDERLEAADNEAWLERRMAELPSSEYQVLYMRQVERRTNGEIAAILGIETTSVATFLSRARRKLLEAVRRRNK